ncbi:hypothetical protein Pelo_13465 [Pelomyxa schiedti]|nr:hypothetical protein Pelo_13465 [Pelomyxa schiedti]
MSQDSPISSPIRLLESLVVISADDKRGTPQPSSASIQFVSGLHAVEAKNWMKAKDAFTKAMVDAEKPNSPKTDLALALLGLGYYMASCPARDITKALQAYKASLGLWETVHTKHSPHLAPLIFDVGVLTAANGNCRDAVKIIQRSVNLWKKAPAEVNVSPIPGEERLTLEVAERNLIQLKEALAQQGGAEDPAATATGTAAPATPAATPTSATTQPTPPPSTAAATATATAVATPTTAPASYTTTSNPSPSSHSSSHSHSSGHHKHKSHH